MIAFTSFGSTLWTVPNDTPQIATADGGVIGASGTTYDQNGKANGQVASLSPPSTQSKASWAGSAPATTPLTCTSPTLLQAHSIFSRRLDPRISHTGRIQDSRIISANK